MLRNRLLPHLQPSRAKSKNASCTNTTRQSTILGKLFGIRVAGTKKRWYPRHDANTNCSNCYQPPNVIFQASQFGKFKSSGSKNNTRRMSVLNKLFMTHITDLLATGQTAESILGLGLQVSRVKISADFTCINVYWLGGDISLEAELQSLSGQLRHELSQLRLMGEVPRIKFVHDKTSNNINNVEEVLRTLNLNKPTEDQDHDQDNDKHEKQQLQPNFDVAQTMRQEFYGNTAPPSPSGELTEMRHDVFGLNHHLIMHRILVKMRISKRAWEQHQQIDQQQSIPELARMQRKLDEVEAQDLTSKSNQFHSFLAKRRERKQTPPRKKTQWELEDWPKETPTGENELQTLTPDPCIRYTQEDYILEDHKDYRNS